MYENGRDAAPKSSEPERLNTTSGRRSEKTGSGINNTTSGHQTLHAVHKTGENFFGGISMNISEQDIGVIGKGVNMTPKSRDLKKTDSSFNRKDSSKENTNINKPSANYKTQ
jgi:hypothetical protein